MNLAHLQAFASVAQHASFSTAAEALHLTQPAVSKRIVALEQSLDTRLFDRTGRQVLLTEAGQVLLEHATRVLEELDAARRRIHDLSGNIRGRLVIATSHHVGLRRLPPVLQAFKHRFPEVRLELRFLESEEALAVVAARVEIPRIRRGTRRRRRRRPRTGGGDAAADHPTTPDRQAIVA